MENGEHSAYCVLREKTKRKDAKSAQRLSRITQYAILSRTMIAQQTASESQASILDVIKNRNFTKLWSAQMLSQTAQQIVNLALVLQVDSLTHSGTATSGIIVAFTIPAILFAAIAGVFVERNSKKLMLVMTNIARGVLVLLYTLINPEWGVGIVLPLFYIVTLLFSGVSQFFNPAEASMIPMVVQKRELISANSLFNLTLSAAQLVGFVVLGPLLLNTIFHNNYNGLYVVIFILCLAAAGMTYLLPQDQPAATVTARRAAGEVVSAKSVATGTTEIARTGFRQALEELAEGWRFIRRDMVIMSAILYWSIAIAVFMMLGVIGPGFLERALGIDKSQLFYILMPGGLGLVIGVLTVGRIAKPENRESMINWSLLMAGITLLAFAAVHTVLTWAYQLLGRGSGAVPPEWLTLGLLGFLTMLLGFFNSFISVPAQTALQERAPEEIRARVFSAFYTVSNAILIVPVLLSGALADWIGYPQTVAVIGALVIVIAAVGLYHSRGRRGEGAGITGTGTGSNGHVTPQEAEAALAVGSPAPRPLPAEAQPKPSSTK